MSGDDLPSYRGPFKSIVQAVIAGQMGSKGTNTLSSHGVPVGFDRLIEVSSFEPLAGIESLTLSEDTFGIPWGP